MSNRFYDSLEDSEEFYLDDSLNTDDDLFELRDGEYGYSVQVGDDD